MHKLIYRNPLETRLSKKIILIILNIVRVGFNMWKKNSNLYPTVVTHFKSSFSIQQTVRLIQFSTLIVANFHLNNFVKHDSLGPLWLNQKIQSSLMDKKK